ncbi:MAG: hypothetical protein M0Z94_02710 [Dehalococcoidales bacterium]|nr:hypothetical protein [Dehalococcoidales bacterium]
MNEERMTAEQHAERIAGLVRQAKDECRADISRVSDPKAKALFETLAEVLDGAAKALDHYSQHSEPAWRQ